MITIMVTLAALLSSEVSHPTLSHHAILSLSISSSITSSSLYVVVRTLLFKLMVYSRVTTSWTILIMTVDSINQLLNFFFSNIG